LVSYLIKLLGSINIPFFIFLLLGLFNLM
jgi:hypothetical protein